MRYDPQVDLHRLAEERSLAYHQLVCERLAADPLLLQHARGHVERWRDQGLLHPEYADAWSHILALPAEARKAAILDPGERGRALRQVTPFAGAVDPRTRWRVWREVRERFLP